jgi:hypothetical protein
MHCFIILYFLQCTYKMLNRELKQATTRGSGTCGRLVRPSQPVSTSALPEAISACDSATLLTRRSALAAAAIAVTTVRCAPARAALVDEDVATSVYEAASPSIVSVVDYRGEGAGEEATGLGSGTRRAAWPA